MLETILYVFALVASATAGYGVGYVVRGKRERVKLAERLDHERLKRRNELLDRGRTSARRPEHDGEQPARISKVRIRSERPRPRR